MSILDDVRYWWANLDAKLRKIIIIGGVILLVALVALTLVALTSGNNNLRDKCRFSSTRPKSTDSPRAVIGAGNRDMAKLDGYIIINEVNYLALDINQLTVDRRLPGGGTIKLDDDCVTLSINFIDTEAVSVALTQLEWTFKSHTEGNEQPYGRCVMSIHEFKHTFPKEEYRYSCLDQQAHQCVKPNDKGELILRSFELELDGFTKEISQSKFSKEPYPNSCSQ